MAAASKGSARGSKAYEREELKALRGAPSEEAQARLWGEARAALAAAGFSGEYDGLLACGEEPRSRRENKGRKDAGGGGAGAGRKWSEEAAAAAGAPRVAGVAEIGSWRNEDLGVSHEHCFEPTVHDTGVVEEPFDQGEDADYEYDSDDDYDGILKPAFAVGGDPDFESGEPLDGFEYLRRVRWEAKQIPKVKVAKIDLSAARKEQTPYMPEIPNIPKCSPDLRASKQWEDAFIAHFSETRMVFSERDSYDKPSVSGGVKISSKPGSRTESQTDPTLTMVCNMDPVARAATLRNYIDMVQSLDSLSRNNCLWLFALCVAVDAPLDAETSASLRSLLRKCAAILATKSEMDDEVIMLNILMAISGRYFGQYENRCD